MLKDEVETVLKLDSHLGKRVIGQNHALEMISERIRTSKASLEDPSKPIGVFLLVGPSGVGKTETALGLAEGPNLTPLQEAFMERFAAQCGFCTSGMLMAAKALLDNNPSPTREDVAEAISGNICRCTGYEPIITAILAAAGSAGRQRA